MELKNIHGTVLFTSQTAQTTAELVAEAVKAKTDLTRADLSGANLTGADLTGAYLNGAYLGGAYLNGAYLTGADLSGANLGGAYLSGAYLSGANLTIEQMPPFLIVPDGTITGWKKLRGGVIAKLEIPAEAARINSTGRKCRAEYAKVVELFGAESSTDLHTGLTIYTVGKTVRPDQWDADFRVECTHGIHFFITRKEAEAYE